MELLSTKMLSLNLGKAETRVGTTSEDSTSNEMSSVWGRLGRFIESKGNAETKEAWDELKKRGKAAVVDKTAKKNAILAMRLAFGSTFQEYIGAITKEVVEKKKTKSKVLGTTGANCATCLVRKWQMTSLIVESMRQVRTAVETASIAKYIGLSQGALRRRTH